MAIYPCAVGLHRFTGRQESAYLGVANGAMGARSKLRMCSAHFKDLNRFVAETLILVSIGEVFQSEDEPFSQNCAHHPDQDASWRAYANLYPRGDEPRVYAASLCNDCSDAFRRVGQIELS